MESKFRRGIIPIYKGIGSKQGLSVEAQMQQLKSWSNKAHRDSTKKGSGPSKRQFGIKEYHRAKAKKRDSQIKSKMKRLESELAKNKVEKPIEESGVKFQ